MEPAYLDWFLILIILVIIAGFFLSGLIMAVPDYFSDFSRRKKMQQLAKDFDFQFESKSSFPSFMFSARWFYTENGAIHRHSLSGQIGKNEIEICDSIKYVTRSRWRGGGFSVEKTIVKINRKVMGEMTPPEGFISTDELRTILQKLR